MNNYQGIVQSKKMDSQLVECYLHICAICRHEFFIDVGASLSDAALGGIDTAPTPNLQKECYEFTSYSI